MVIDLDRCTGCRACMIACKVENNTPQASLWMYVFRLEAGEYPDTCVWFMPRPCMHCRNAPCVKVCPVGARFRQEDGIVATDWQRCIGCRYCEVACPYGVNVFNWMDPAQNYYLDWNDEDVVSVTGGAVPGYKNPELDERHGTQQRYIAGGGHRRGVIEKCTFCVHRVEKGLKPACVVNCPAFALHFGDLDDPDSEVSRLLARRPSFRLLEELGTQPSVYYVGGAPPPEGAREIERVALQVNVRRGRNARSNT
ncbi:MAG: 4Fe-4S dicluster domain-containing protein [Anaerolineae bacterium]